MRPKRLYLLVIISAHYNHIGTTSNVLPFEHKDKNPIDAIFNGANDDASGIVAMLEIAKYYKSFDSIKPTILFIAFAGEELGLLGSQYFATFCGEGTVDAVINLEMLGRSLYNKEVFVINEIGGKNLAKQLNNNLAKVLNKKKETFFVPDSFSELRLSTRNDAASFVNVSKNAFCLIATNDKDPYYHTSRDEANTLDYNFFTLAIKNIALACKAFLY
jgi:aminopeptidase YwaD